MHEYQHYCWHSLHQFIWDHSFLSWPQTSCVLPVLTATSFPVCDHRKTSDCSLCVIRAVDSECESTLNFIFLSTLHSCFTGFLHAAVSLELSQHISPSWATERLVVSSSNLKMSVLSPPDLSNFTHSLHSAPVFQSHCSLLTLWRAHVSAWHTYYFLSLKSSLSPLHSSSSRDSWLIYSQASCSQ
jgi:hypothetical protein